MKPSPLARHLYLEHSALPEGTRAIRLDAVSLPADGRAPKEVRLLRLGENKTRSYGSLWLTAEGMASCLRLEQQLGRDLPWDWYHQSEVSPFDQERQRFIESGLASGWFSLRAGHDGLYSSTPRVMAAGLAAAPEPKILDGTFWEPTAKAAIETFKVRHYSPGILIRDQNGRTEIVGVTSAALTNSPETLDQPPLLLAVQPGHNMKTWEEILKELTDKGASQAEIDAEKKKYDAEAAARATPPPPDAAQMAAQLAKRQELMAAHANRYTPAEVPSLDVLDLPTLEKHLLARPVIPLMRQPVIPLAVRAGAQITDAGSAIGHNGRAWWETNNRERDLLFRVDRTKYDRMKKNAQDLGMLLATVKPEHMRRPIGPDGIRALSLATGPSVPANNAAIITDVLNVAIDAGFAGVSILQNSPVCTTTVDLPNFLEDGRPVQRGSTIRYSYWSAIGAFEEVTDEASPPTTIQRLDSTQDTAAVKHFRNMVLLSYALRAYAAEGDDPYDQTVKQLMSLAKNAMEDALIARVRTTTLEFDTTAIGSGKLTYDAIVSAKSKWGDEEFLTDLSENGMFFTHSVGVEQARQVKDSTGRPLFTETQEGGWPRMMGMKTKVSDRLVTDIGNHVATIAKPGALALRINKDKFKVQEFHDVINDRDSCALHLYFAAYFFLHPAGLTKPAAINLRYKP